MFPGMPDGYAVRGAVGGVIPGVVGPSELDGRSEWVRLRAPRDVLEALEARLGSEVDLHRVALAVLAPLRKALEGEALGALTARLPQDLSRELADAGLNLCAAVPPAADRDDYLAAVSRLSLHPAPVAGTYVRAVFAAAKAVLAPEGARAVEERLPPGVAELWRRAR